jgi:hypothetical protein
MGSTDPSIKRYWLSFGMAVALREIIGYYEYWYRKEINHSKEILRETMRQYLSELEYLY